MAIIKKAGGMILAADLEHADVEVKSTRGDLRTNYDTAVEEFLRRELALVLPEAQFIGEESGLQKREADKYCFIVDPIDGTANFTWDYHHSAVSIALAKGERILAGLVYNPYLDELFHARAGEGAYLNGRLIQVSQRSLRDGLICFGTSPYDKTKAAATFSLARLLYEKSLDVRRSGSAALDLCYVACGRCDLFYEMSLYPWDYAAAALIVTEAGGMLATMEGEELRFSDRTTLVAGGPPAFRDFWELYI
ncbi:MAG TPA: inositol monophosphatase family protein [Syntrophomonadaceae bacterium]|nr:inositol monophosphatase family protein [Syntrophomonadaceae bacterium]